jgi:hypothetical protein
MDSIEAALHNWPLSSKRCSDPKALGLDLQSPSLVLYA